MGKSSRPVRFIPNGRLSLSQSIGELRENQARILKESRQITSKLRQDHNQTLESIGNQVLWLESGGTLQASSSIALGIENDKCYAGWSNRPIDYRLQLPISFNQSTTEQEMKEKLAKFLKPGLSADWLKTLPPGAAVTFSGRGNYGYGRTGPGDAGSHRIWIQVIVMEYGHVKITVTDQLDRIKNVAELDTLSVETSKTIGSVTGSANAKILARRSRTAEFDLGKDGDKKSLEYLLMLAPTEANESMSEDQREQYNETEDHNHVLEAAVDVGGSIPTTFENFWNVGVKQLTIRPGDKRIADDPTRAAWRINATANGDRVVHIQSSAYGSFGAGYTATTQLGLDGLPIEGQAGVSGSVSSSVKVINPIKMPEWTPSVLQNVVARGQAKTDAVRVLMSDLDHLIQNPPDPGTEVVVSHSGNLGFFANLIAGYDKQISPQAALRISAGISAQKDLTGDYSVSIKWLKGGEIAVRLGYGAQRAFRQLLTGYVGLDLDLSHFESTIDRSGPGSALGMLGLSPGQMITGKFKPLFGVHLNYTLDDNSKGEALQRVFRIDPTTPEGRLCLLRFKSLIPSLNLEGLPPPVLQGKQDEKATVPYSFEAYLGSLPIIRKVSSVCKHQEFETASGNLEADTCSTKGEVKTISQLLFPLANASIDFVSLKSTLGVHEQTTFIKGTLVLEDPYTSDEKMASFVTLMKATGARIIEKTYKREEASGISKYARTTQDIKFWITQAGLQKISSADDADFRQAFMTAMDMIEENLDEPIATTKNDNRISKWLNDPAAKKLFEEWRKADPGDSDAKTLLNREYKNLTGRRDRLAYDAEYAQLADIFVAELSKINGAAVNSKVFRECIKRTAELAMGARSSTRNKRYFYAALAALCLIAGSENIAVENASIQGGDHVLIQAEGQVGLERLLPPVLIDQAIREIEGHVNASDGQP